MLFATDLDRTLIYSLGAAAGRGRVDAGQLRVVEYLDGGPLSYMTARAIELLRELWPLVRVVPVTTRTIEQYRRIELFGSILVPEYAVAANGGHLVHRGVCDPDWNAAVRAELSGSCAGVSEIAGELSRAGAAWATRVRVADDLFVYAIVDRSAVGPCELADLAERLGGAGWELSLQGRKLYAVPRPLDKWRAVEEVGRRTGDFLVVAAGDSLLDRSLLDRSGFSIRPAHGELEAVAYPADLVTRRAGATAAEEVLEAALGRSGATPRAASAMMRAPRHPTDHPDGPSRREDRPCAAVGPAEDKDR
ncbi:MAG: hypothetical protein ACRD1K_09370 [Acidimicrobiales bacterium]